MGHVLREQRAAAAPLSIPTGDGFHQLRYFYASVLIRSGESVEVVQKRLGHTSATMTLDIYGHLWEQDEEHTRTAIDDVFSNATLDFPGRPGLVLAPDTRRRICQGQRGQARRRRAHPASGVRADVRVLGVTFA